MKLDFKNNLTLRTKMALTKKVLNTKKRRKADNMSPMKNPKRPFYDFKMKIMMYLDYSF